MGLDLKISSEHVCYNPHLNTGKLYSVQPFTPQFLRGRGGIIMNFFEKKNRTDVAQSLAPTLATFHICRKEDWRKEGGKCGPYPENPEAAD